MKKLFITLNLLAITFSLQAETALTIYSSADPASFDPQLFISQRDQGNSNYDLSAPGYAVIKETREITLAKGISEYNYNDVAKFIDPTTVSFKDLTSPDTYTLEQLFKFDIVSPDKIFDRYLNKEISLQVQKGEKIEEIKGELLSYNNNKFVLKTAAGISMFNQNSPEIRLGELPGGLITKPTLQWKVNSASAGKHNIQTTYQTKGITWRTDYNMLLNKDESLADISAWVTILNLSGKTYTDAGLKLVAGDVQKITAQKNNYAHLPYARVGAMEMAAEPGFEEKSFFEYHLYTLPGKTSIADNSTQQLVLFPTANDVKTEKLLVYYGLPSHSYYDYLAEPQLDRQFGNSSNKKVDIYLLFKNKQENNLGIPFPAGKIRVYKTDEADGATEFIGEDLIDHTPKNENIMVKLGSSFDVVGERKQTDFLVDSAKKYMLETIEIELRNNKDVAQKVTIKENLYRWLNWEILSADATYEKVDSRTIHIPVEVAANSKKTVKYQVKYSW